MISDDEYCVRFVSHADTMMRGATMIDENGFSSIYLNARLSSDQLAQTFTHEIQHIKNNDFYNDIPIDMIEGEV